MAETKTRIAQQKTSSDKSIYISLPIIDTGINPGDVVNFEVVDAGTVILRKLTKINISKKRNSIDNILRALELNDQVEYKIKNTMKY